MIHYELLQTEGILVLKPEAALEAADFADLAQVVDPYIKAHGELSGVLIHAKTFPGWANLDALAAHVKFIESHHRKIRRLAVVSDSPLLTEFPKLAARLVEPEFKHFPEAERELAMRWLKQAPEAK